MKKWIVKQIDNENINSADTISPVVTGLGPLAQTVLNIRGIIDVNAAHEFFSADKLHDPFKMKDMSKAVELIKDALTDGTKITVYGDYDCDGITATVMLYNYLTALGGEVDWYIPSREEGYGLNVEALEKLIADDTGMIITVDNGITAFQEAKLLQENGVSLIITDHHTVSTNENEDILPVADAIINPKQKGCEYPFKDLAGCGVVLKLISALEESSGIEVIEQYGDLAAIGTIADIVPLKDENRHIVSLGLQSLECSENVGLYCLIKAAGLSERLSETYGIDSTSIAFVLCPRINAAGRFAHPGKAVELLLCENHEIAMAKAEELNTLNRQRIEEEQRITAEIDSYLSENHTILNERVLVLVGENWHHGIIGIICSRMVTRFGKPCVIITTDGETAKGSCRGLKGFSVHAALTYCKDLLVKFGGHIGAGGLSVKTSDIPAFKERLFEYARKFHDSMPPPEVIAELSPAGTHITIDNIEKLDALQPFGEENPLPVFYLKRCIIKHKRPLKEGKYISFTVEYQGIEFKVLDFYRCYADFWYNIGDVVDLMATFGINEYNDTKSINAKLVDMRLSAINSTMEERLFAAKSTYEKVIRNEDIDAKLYSRIIPGSAEMKTAYNIIKNAVCLDEILQKGLIAGINYCMLRIIINVFDEMGLVEFCPVTNNIKIIKTEKKADLEKSLVLARLRERGNL